MRRAVRLAGVTAGLVGAAAVGAALGTARSLVVPRPRPMENRILSIDFDAHEIELDRNHDTTTPGRFGLFVDGSRSYLQLGEVVRASDDGVVRALETPLRASDTFAPECSLSAWYFDDPAQLGLPYREVSITTGSGMCPAWVFPVTTADARHNSTWVVHIHGRGVRRAECLRAVNVFHALGLPSLIVSYRNDGEAAQTKRGSYGLGATEWEDVDAAIAYAREHGARQVILQGYSMGGAIAFQTLLRSAQRRHILGLVLDSPVVDWKSVLAVHAHEGRVPGPIAKLAMWFLRHPISAQLCGSDGAIALDEMNMNARAAELDVPILLLISSGDAYVPDGPAIELSRQRPDLVTRVQFERAPHTALWNYDPSLWDESVAAWLRTCAGV